MLRLVKFLMSKNLLHLNISSNYIRYKRITDESFRNLNNCEESVSQIRLQKFAFFSLFHLPNNQTKTSKRATTAYIYKHFQSKLNKALLIQINQPTRSNNFSILLLDVYVQLNMFRAFSRPSSGAQQLQ